MFARVVELRSISSAARKLGLSKSTISRNVARLEETVGARLVQRSTRGLGLTDTGTVFHRHCLRILEEVEAAEVAVSHLQGAPRGLLRVSVPATFGHVFLGPLLAEFLLSYPELRVALEVTNRRVDLVEEGVDVAIRAGRLADSSLISRKLGEARFVLCASPAYLHRRGSPREPAELATHEVADVAPLEGSRTWVLTCPAGQKVEISLAPRLGVNDPGMVYWAVMGGAVLGRVPEFLCVEDLRAGRLRQLLPGWSLPVVEVHALFPSSRDLPPKVRTFVDFLVGKLSAMQPGKVLAAQVRARP
jgi:DNA-binding transcriptional LysR family regulator